MCVGGGGGGGVIKYTPRGKVCTFLVLKVRSTCISHLHVVGRTLGMDPALSNPTDSGGPEYHGHVQTQSHHTRYCWCTICWFLHVSCESPQTANPSDIVTSIGEIREVEEGVGGGGGGDPILRVALLLHTYCSPHSVHHVGF